MLSDDPISSLYSMHANIGDVLEIHFKLNGKWWVSSKNVLKSLSEWDEKLARLLGDFVATADVDQKFAHWSAIIDHVAAAMGGRQPIAENNCSCDTCQSDLTVLSD